MQDKSGGTVLNESIACKWLFWTLVGLLKLELQLLVGVYAPLVVLNEIK